jgi:nucleoside-diphosphate kinase
VRGRGAFAKTLYQTGTSAGYMIAASVAPHVNCRACQPAARLPPELLPLSLGFRKVNAMALERTLSIVKPDGVSANLIGAVYRRFEEAGLAVIAARMLQLSQREAEAFYAVHRERGFFPELVRYMSSGPVMIQVLEGENAIARNRDIMGATDPKKAAPGTIRADFATSIERNVVHGSDGPETAAREIAFFFSLTELHPRA